MFRFFQAGEGGAPPVLDYELSLGWEAGAQNEGAGFAAGVLYSLGFAYCCDAEEGDVFLVKGFDDAFNAVSVGFRFHNGHLLVLRQDATYNA